VAATLCVGWIAVALLALALLNLCTVWIAGGFTLVSWPVRIASHSWWRAFAAVAVLTGWRLVWTNRASLSARHVRAWVQSHALDLTVGALVAMGLFLRLWGITNGAHGPDEPDVVGHAIDMLKRSSLDPRWYHYPPLFLNLLLPSFAIYFVMGVGHGLWSTLAEVPTNAHGFYVVARAHSAVLGAATVWLTYRLGCRVWPASAGRIAGSIAAALVAVSFNHVRSSHFALTDAPLGAVVAAALIAILAMCATRRRRDYLLAGLLVGLACSTKYSAAPLVGSFLLAHCWGQPVRRWVSVEVLLGLVAMPVGFLAGSPAILTDWHIFLEHVGWLQSFSGAATSEDIAQRFGLIATSVFGSGGFGWPGAALSLIALAAVLYRPRREEIVLLAFVVLSLAAITHSSHRWFPRYLVPLYPPVYVLAGGLLVRLTEIGRRQSIRPAYLLIVLLVIVAAIAAPQLAMSLAYDVALAYPQ
jgi:hypothetical protein